MQDTNWTTVARGRKADHGHTAVAMRTTYNHNGFERNFVRCQCGKVYSGWGQRGYYSYSNHRDAAVEAATTVR